MPRLLRLLGLASVAVLVAAGILGAGVATAHGNPESDACQSYVAFRDFTARDWGSAIESYFTRSVELVAEMEATAGSDAATLRAFGQSIEAVGVVFASNAWQEISGAAITEDLVPVVEESGFDTLEKEVWDWASKVCGPSWTACRGLLASIVDVSISDPSLGYLVDPGTCGSPSRELAATGAESAHLAIIGLAIMLGGAMVAFSARRRRLL